jgi:subtilisin family serine protease
MRMSTRVGKDVAAAASAADGKSAPAAIRPVSRPSTVEALEPRQHLAWGPYPQLIDQDELVARYPAVTGKGVVMAVIDTGMDFGHPRLQGKWWVNSGETPFNNKDDDANGYVDDYRGYDFYREDGDPNDENSHGTQMGGIIAGHMWQSGGFDYAGIAPDVKVIPLKVADPSGRIDDISFCRRVERALQWVEKNLDKTGVSIISMSIRVNDADFLATFDDEVERLAARGVFIVASSGHFEPLANQVVAPANHPAVYAAGMIDANDKMPDKGQRGPDLDLLAPSDRIPILHKGSAYLISGTASSYPTPYVAAAAALLKQVNRKFTPAQMMKIMQDSGKPIFDEHSDRTYRRLDLDDAVKLAYQRSGGQPKPDAGQRPFKGSPFKTGKIIQAEDFDEGGQGVSYNDRTTRPAGAYRRTQVGILPIPGGQMISGVRAGEWLEYTLNVAEAGTYKFLARLRSASRGGTFRVEIDGSPITGALKVPDTGKKWKTIKRGGIELSEGRHVVRIFFIRERKGAVGDFDWFRFKSQ